MAKLSDISSKKSSIIFYLLLLVITLGQASSARILDEVNPQPTGTDASDLVAPSTVADEAPLPEPSTTLPAVTAPVVAPVVAPVSTSFPEADIPDTVIPPVVPDVAPIATPVVADVAPVATPVVADLAPVATPVVTSPSGPASIPGGATGAANPQLSFFMHDILGGTHPSGRVVTGIVANSDMNNLPFSKPNNQVFPINGGVPLNTVNGVINNNNAPFLVGLNGSPTNTILQNNGNNNIVNNNGNNNLPFVSAGQLPTGLTLQQLMFGSVTVVDNEITEGHELGSAVLGKVQGFYLSSSSDGTSHTLVLTALFHGGEHDVDDTVSFFGIHRTGSPVSEIAVIGGTGKYEDARGYATIEALPQQDQHTTDGVETITQFNVYLTA